MDGGHGIKKSSILVVCLGSPEHIRQFCILQGIFQPDLKTFLVCPGCAKCIKRHRPLNKFAVRHTQKSTPALSWHRFPLSGINYNKCVRLWETMPLPIKPHQLFKKNFKSRVKMSKSLRFLHTNLQLLYAIKLAYLV